MLGEADIPKLNKFQKVNLKFKKCPLPKTLGSVRYVSLVNDSVLGQFSKDVVKIDGVGKAVRMSRYLGGLVVDIVPGDAVVSAGRRRHADREDQASVEGFLEELGHLSALLVVRQVGHPGEPDQVVGLARVRMLRALKAASRE